MFQTDRGRLLQICYLAVGQWRSTQNVLYILHFVRGFVVPQRASVFSQKVRCSPSFMTYWIKYTRSKLTAAKFKLDRNFFFFSKRGLPAEQWQWGLEYVEYKPVWCRNSYWTSCVLHFIKHAYSITRSGQTLSQKTERKCSMMRCPNNSITTETFITLQAIFLRLSSL